ncbi:MAG: FAD-dependent oxidoreductase, partial [Synergistaceae bacterium]|nr:FAD-dependent oxidoreductase [Synergistaceae bacterium]
MILNRSRKFFVFLAALALLLATFSGPSLASLSYDVVVAGGGSGGVSAAIAAARLGVRVALLEETDWLGGQMTAAAVSTMDDLSGNRSGIYGEFYSEVGLHYFLKGKSVSTCYWDGGTMAFEPSVGRSILSSMVTKASKTASTGGRKGTLDLFYSSRITGVKREGSTVRKVTADLEGKKTEMNCTVLIDATELGDVIPLARIRYRAGNSQSPTIDGEGRIQDITWLAVIKKYPGGVPLSLCISTPPPGYDRYAPAFRKIVAAGGNSFRDYPLKLPVDFATHNGYRGLPDSSNPENYNAATPEGWEAITKTGVNWANDYPGAEKWEERSGLPVAYIEDLQFRRKVDGEAIVKTLCFLYYIQQELGEPWSVADDEFFSPLPVELTREILGDEYAEVLRRLPLIAYVRESRRIVGLETPTSTAVRTNSESYKDGREGREIPT